MKEYIIIGLIFMITAMVVHMDNARAKEGPVEKATLAGGCFWCMEPPYEKLDGVKDVISGYTGGHKKNPTYKEVSSDKTGHVEAVQITFDPSVISYNEILDIFWRQIDPTDPGGQFVDRGSSYLSAIFYHSEEQRKTAEASKKELESSGKFDKPIVTSIRPAMEFYRAEDYHQDYYKKNPLRYKFYRFNSGRDQFLKKTWESSESKDVSPKENTYVKPSKEQLKMKLSDIQYKVTQEEGTEPPFRNEYWDNKKEGIYVDIVSGEPLFISTDKYDSGTGWPSFTRPLEPDNIIEKADRSLFMTRTEVRSKHGDSHLGHVFNDGPEPTGLRYCINSASLKFVEKSELEKEGYGEYLDRF